MIQLSVLVPTLPSRLTSFYVPLIENLNAQIQSLPVEIVGLLDNYKRTVGSKRNELLRLAQGLFVSFVDDDDRIAPDYIESILGAIGKNPEADVIVFDQTVSINGGSPKKCLYGIEFPYKDTPSLWTGLPAHTMAWRRDIVKDVQFPDKSYGEDTDWVKQAVAGVKKQVRIDKTLYHYEFNNKTTETRTPPKKVPFVVTRRRKR